MAPWCTMTRWWHRITVRAGRFVEDLPDIVRHEGLVTATTVFGYRSGRLIKQKVLALTRHWVGVQNERQGILASAVDETIPHEPGIQFMGYVEAGLGLGVSLRGLIDCVADTDVPFGIFPFNVNVESRYIGPFRSERYDFIRRYRINVIETAADQLPMALSTLGESRTRASHNILRTYWELPEAPELWRGYLNNIDEIWAPNDFVADAFRKIFLRPIVIIPPCVEVQPATPLDRTALGLEEGLFYFLFTFDYFSYPARKNPLGVLRAFQTAFPRGDERVGLVIKSTGSHSQFPDVHAVIESAARRDRRIVVIDLSLRQSDMMSLIAGCGCYVSLHRSEGFGLGMVEAMLHGRPVIGTDYSGSTDFLSPERGYPVDFRLRPVKRGEYLYSEGQSWAEPELSSAVAAMRAVLAEPEVAAAKAVAAQAFVKERYSRNNVGGLVAARVDSILNSADRRAALPW